MNWSLVDFIYGHGDGDGEAGGGYVNAVLLTVMRGHGETFCGDAAKFKPMFKRKMFS